jgi:hypothetical protein
MKSFQTNAKEDSSRAAANNASKAGLSYGHYIQRKLTINQPDDVYEQEADFIADKVMRSNGNDANVPDFFNVANFPLQRKCAACETEEKLKRKEFRSTEPNISPAIEQTLQSTGNPMDQSTLSFMENRFGYDFSNVQIHNDALAHQSSNDINAFAYTHNNHIAFGAGQYNPQSESGKRLLAHELTHVIQQTSSIQTSSTIARATSEAKSFPESDGSEVTVVRTTNPGHCVLVPKTQTKTSGDINSKNAFFQFDFCRGGYGGKVRGQINYGDAIDKASKAAQDFFTNIGRGQDPRQAADALKAEIDKVAPDAEVQINFQSKDVRVNVSGTGEASRGSGVSGEGKGTVEVDIGPVTVGAEGKISGASGERTDYQVLITIKNADNGPGPADCRICNCTEPDITYSCTKKPPAGKEPPGGDSLQPVTIPLFFEYKYAYPRKGWEDEYHAMLKKATGLISQGYTIEKIEGNTSPEGPTGKVKGSDFEGNIELADKRAAKAWADLQTEIGKELTIAMRSAKQLKSVLDSNPPVHGAGEILGSTDKGEVKNEDLYKHIKQSVTASEKEGKDIFTEAQILGEDLPEEVGKENQQLIDEFTSGKRGKQKLSQSEQLEALYKTMRRALIFLTPPAKVFDARQAEAEAAKKITGESVDCTEANKKLLNEAIPVSTRLFEGECNEQGKETKRFPE